MATNEPVLEYENKNGWKLLTAEERAELDSFCEDYKQFLDAGKTERDASDELVRAAAAAGFTDLDEVLSSGRQVKPGDKLYAVNRGKSCAFIVIGKNDPVRGFNMIGAHIDCPRLDFKPKPIYEDNGLVLAKTHYYGGIKKYQWVATPLALHGVVYCNKGAEVKKITIGEDPGDPVFYISDLLPHLAQDQMVRNGAQVIQGEQLNVILGSVPAPDPVKTDAAAKAGDNGAGEAANTAEGTTEAVPKDDAAPKISLKKALLQLLYDKYGITEGDFQRAEFEVVPQAKASDVGFDRGLIGAYGQDDRVCAYTAFRALLDSNDIPDRTAVIYLSDKEEIGSMGNTGARSNWLENLCLELISLCDRNCSMLELRRALRNTRFLSADVTAAFDPTFPEVSDRLNVAFAGAGIAFEKYTGHGGKAGASDASAEFVSFVLDTLDSQGIPWQLTEMGRVDLGGGGTIAQYMADLGMDVIDCGVPVLSMHSPFELTSKADVYWSYRAYGAFLRT